MARNGNYGRNSGKGLKIVYWIQSKLNRKKNTAEDKSSRLYTYTNSYHQKLSKKEQRHRDYVRGAPKSRIKRILWYINPKRWKYLLFTHQGRIKLAKFAAACFAVLILFSVGMYAYFKSELPSPEELNGRGLAQTTKFYDNKGEKLLFEVYGDQKRTIVKEKEISKYMRNATVAIEDKDYYKHGGFSIKGITRAFINNLFNRSTQGGSTITQQYIKNALLTNDRKITRKIKELILSIELERLYNKEEILTAYLNEIPYGSLEYGVEAVSQSFFDKPAKDLTLDEAAMLAAIPQAPTLYSPYSSDPSLLLARQDTVIDRMQEQGYITKAEAKEAKKVDTLAKLSTNRNRYKGVVAPHFVLEAQKELEADYGATTVNKSGWKVITSLDLELQATAEKVAAEKIGLVERSGGDNLALTLGDQRTGQIKAMVGSRDFNYPGYGAFNAATASRQPGSSFKPYAYAELFETGKWGPGSVLYDLKTDFGGYEPTNFNKGEQNGAIPIRRAIGKSLNIPAVKALYIAGIDNVIDQAQAQGITTLKDRKRFGLALVLGAGEVKLADHVTGYEAFANGGLHYDQTYIQKIEAPNGDVVKDNTKPKGKRVLDEQVAYLMTNILSDRSVRSVNGVGVTAALKTGTTSDTKDFWTMGYSDYITAGVWVGNHDNTEMGASSSLTISPIWVQLMNEVHKQKNWPSREFNKPAGIKQVTLDSDTGRTPTEATKRKHSDIFASNYIAPKAGAQVSYTIDTISGKLATDCTPEGTKQTVNGDGIDAEIAKDDPAYNRWASPIKAYAAKIGRAFGAGKPTATDDVHNCSDAKPVVNSVNVSPSGGSYVISANVSQGTHPLTEISFSVDGTGVGVQGGAGSGNYVASVAMTAGSHTVSVTAKDSLGYSDEGSTTYNAASSGISNVTAEKQASNVRVSWASSFPDGTSYLICYTGPASLCDTKTQLFKIFTFGGKPAGSYLFTVSANGDSKNASLNWP